FIRRFLTVASSGGSFTLSLHDALPILVLATGSTQYAARPVAQGVGIEHVLSSELEVERGVFTGRPAALCFGHHKVVLAERWGAQDRKSTRLNSSHRTTSYAVFCLKKKK